MGLEIIQQSLIIKENLNPYQYTISLLKEGYRAGLIDKQAVDNIQGQIMLILKDLITRYTKGDSSSVKIETAERILNSIYYSIDAYTISFKNPEESIVLLKTKSVKEIYEAGVALVTACVAETKMLYEEIRKKKLDVPLEVYNAAIDEDLPGFFEEYGVIFGAHETNCSADYPLIFDDMNIQGIFYIKQYLENLAAETEFCSLFTKEDTLKLLEDYGRIYRVDYKQSPFNLCEIVINNAIFSVLSGNAANRLSISCQQLDILQDCFVDLNLDTLKSLLDEAVTKMKKDLKIDQPRLIDYIYRYETIFTEQISNAVKNGSLHNLILSDAVFKIRNNIVFEEGVRMNDENFRVLIRRIGECANLPEKIHLIKSEVHSLEDFLDLFKVDCLFGDDFIALFNALSDMELAVLGRIVFFEEVRNGPVDLTSLISAQKEMEQEWQAQYMRFLRGLSESKIKIIERLLNIIE